MATSDWVEKLTSEKRKWSPTFRDERSKKIDEMILGLLIEAKNGIQHLDLAERVGINRKSLTLHTNRLIEQGLIVRKDGKQGRYFVTRNVFGSIYVIALLFGRKFEELLPTEADDSITISKLSKPLLDSCIVPESHRAAKKFGLSKSLFEFSNVIGAYITFLLIQATNPNNKKIHGGRKNFPAASQIWIEKAISSAIPALLFLFQRYMEFCILKYKDFRSEDDYFSFIADRNSFTAEILDSYEKLYPIVFRELDKTRDDYLT